MAVSLSANVLALCTSVPHLKFLATVMIQGGKMFRSGGYPPEDTKTYGAVPTEEENENKRLVRACEAEYRWNRIVMNDLESIPMGLFVFGIGVFVNASEKVQVGAMTVSTLARLVHTYMYAHEMQPHRGRAWVLATAMVLMGVGNMVASIAM